ncbi:MAG: hypothetical protein ACHQCE_02520 [Streptosporangiales bacterium]
MKRKISRNVKLWLLAASVVVTFSLGWYLERIAFQPPGAPGQAFVTVFTKDRAANVSLKAIIHPSSPWEDWLTVHVDGVHGKPERWLLVVQCPAVPAAPEHTVGLYPEAGPQLSAAPSMVIASPHNGKLWKGYLRCFSAPGSSQTSLQAQLSLSNGVPGFSNATLPALETDPAMAAAQEPPQLYAERDNSSRRIADLVEVFPTCSQASPSATATISPAPTGTASQQPSANAGGQPSSTAPPTAQVTSSPNPGISSCYSPESTSTTPDVYRLPASAVTTEVLDNVNLSGYRIDSMFPPGQFGRSDQITWQGISSLSPSLLVTNLTAEHNLNRYTFFSGILFGICGGAVVTLLVESVDAWREARKREGPAVAEQEGSTG